MNAKERKLKNLKDKFDLARIAHKLGHVDKEIAFVFNVAEELELCRGCLTTQDHNTLRNFARHRNYHQACVMLGAWV